jgi:EthD domain
VAELERWILAVSPSGAWAEEPRAAFEAWARTLAEPGQGHAGVEMEWLAPEAHRLHTGTDAPPRFHAFASVWTEVGFDPATAGGPAGETVHPFQVHDTVRIDYPRDWTDNVPTPGVKKTTFWCASDACAGDWRSRYEHHADVVRECHRSAWRYRQNLVESRPASGPAFDAVSELWWPDADGLVLHFYADDTARDAVADDTVFVDRADATPVVTVHTVLRTPPAERAGAPR